MTVAEMCERMSLREYVQWISFLKAEDREREKALRQARGRRSRGR